MCYDDIRYSLKRRQGKNTNGTRFEEPVDEPGSFMREPADAATKDVGFFFFFFCFMFFSYPQKRMVDVCWLMY